MSKLPKHYSKVSSLSQDTGGERYGTGYLTFDVEKTDSQTKHAKASAADSPPKEEHMVIPVPTCLFISFSIKTARFLGHEPGDECEWTPFSMYLDRSDMRGSSLELNCKVATNAEATILGTSSCGASAEFLEPRMYALWHMALGAFIGPNQKQHYLNTTALITFSALRWVLYLHSQLQV